MPNPRFPLVSDPAPNSGNPNGLRPGLELISFVKGQRKDDRVWRTQRRYNRATGTSYAWLVRSTAFINFFYFYCVDADFGPFFLKFGTYGRVS